MNNIPAIFSMFLLQSSIWFRHNQANDVIIFVLGIGILTVILIISNILRKKK